MVDIFYANSAHLESIRGAYPGSKGCKNIHKSEPLSKKSRFSPIVRYCKKTYTKSFHAKNHSVIDQNSPQYIMGT